MNTIDITAREGLTLKDLKVLIERCEKANIPDNVKIFIGQHEDEIVSDALHILADDESINIYDWL
jgi:predicted oxidoreductase